MVSVVLIFHACNSWYCFYFFFSSRRRHTRCLSDWSSDVCSSDLTTPVQDGMSVTTNSEKLTQYRKIAIEFLFSERNHRCAVCVSNNHCELQSMAQRLGVTSVRYPYAYPKLGVDVSHPRFVLDHNRCILC